MNKQLIEAMAQERGWVVKYALDGTPSFFYPIYKCTSKSLDPSLPDRTHPAFIVNGQEIDRVLVGVYLGSESNGAVHSLPMRAPKHSVPYMGMRNLCVAAGPGFTGNTVAISGLILLLARKNGWVPKGNNSYGVDYRDASHWLAGQSYTVGIKRVHLGWEYTCLIAHTSTYENRPAVAPHLWKIGKQLGGIPVSIHVHSGNPNGITTLTGSGPASWSLGGTPNGLSDVNGNCAAQDYGYRIMDGELQIIENNNALHPDTDVSDTSLAWKAILRNTGNDGHTLVAPGTPNTLKWNKTDSGNPSSFQLDTVISSRMVDAEYGRVAFSALTANAANLPHVPAILKELGIFPIAGDTTQGSVYVRNQVGLEYVPRRGGYYINSTSNAGLGFAYCNDPRGSANSYFGVRSAFLETL